MTDERDSLPHPMQPIGYDDRNIARFKENGIVRFLLDNGPFSLNELSMMLAKGKFSQEDYTQLMQLIGYSVSGYGELSTSPPELVTRADEEAGKLWSKNL